MTFRSLTTTVRPSVDVDLMLRSMLQRAFANTGVRVDVSFPGVDRLPSISAARIGGVADWPPGAVDRPRVSIVAYSRSRQEASNIAQSAVALLQSSEGDEITVGDGVRLTLVAVTEDAGLVVSQENETAQGIYAAAVVVVLTIHQFSPLTPT